MNDDGEPSSTAGRPIFGQLRSKDVTNVLLVVVRYFGGVKLGVSGLINAYKTAAQEALDNSEIIEKVVEEHYQIAFRYEEMNRVMSLLKGSDVTIISQSFDNQCIIVFKVRQSMADRYLSELRKMGEVVFKKITA
jgi:putative IMPACT (imprinted ancient) family translation regulator